MKYGAFGSLSSYENENLYKRTLYGENGMFMKKSSKTESAYKLLCGSISD